MELTESKTSDTSLCRMFFCLFQGFDCVPPCRAADAEIEVFLARQNIAILQN